MNISNDDTYTIALAVRSKDIRQAVIRRYLNYQNAVKSRENLVVKKEEEK